MDQGPVCRSPGHSDIATSTTQRFAPSCAGLFHLFPHLAPPVLVRASRRGESKRRASMTNCPTRSTTSNGVLHTRRRCVRMKNSRVFDYRYSASESELCITFCSVPEYLIMHARKTNVRCYSFFLHVCKYRSRLFPCAFLVPRAVPIELDSTERRLFCIFVHVIVETIMESDRLVKQFDHLAWLLDEFIFSLVILALPIQLSIISCSWLFDRSDVVAPLISHSLCCAKAFRLIAICKCAISGKRHADGIPY